MRNVIVAGGWSHPAEENAPALAATLDDLGITSVIVDNLTDAPAAIATTDLVTIACCRFQMLDPRYDDETRAEWASHSPPRFVDAMTRHVERGRALLSVHTAVLCFDDWPQWAQLLGGSWDWTCSGHPPPQPMTVRTPSGDFEVIDEQYQYLSVASTSEVIATSTDADGVAHPIAWINSGGAYCALGHDARSYTASGHRDLLARLLHRG